MRQISESEEEDFAAGIVLSIKEDEILSGNFQELGITVDSSGNVFHKSSYTPPINKGKFSKKNLQGWSVVRRDLPKERKTFYLGERPIWGSYSNGTFSLYATKSVFPKEDFLAPELQFLVQFQGKRDVAGTTLFVFKITVGKAFKKSSYSNEELLFALNLLQENFGQAEVYFKSEPIEIPNTIVSWEIFPPGTRETDLELLASSFSRPLSEEEVKLIAERRDILAELQPIDFIRGLSGDKRYFGARYADDLVVFENLEYGNAIYILFEDWSQLSRLSRTELQNLPKDKFIRIPHTKSWKDRVIGEITKRRPGEAA